MRSLITKDRQKKLLHRKTGRESEGGISGLAGLPQGQLKFLRDISAAMGFPLRGVGSKHKAGLTSLQHQKQQSNQDNIQL